jgi:hypothetical protein
MILKALNSGRVSGTGTVTVNSEILGGVLITTNGSDAVTVTVQRVDSGGKTIFSVSTTVPMFAAGPMSLEKSDAAYYSVSGTGGTAQFYEWIN